MKNKTNYGKKITNKLILKMISAAIIYTTLFVVIYIVGQYICSQFFWEERSMLYQFLVWIAYNPLNLIIIYLIGLFIIILVLLRKTFYYIDIIVEESEKLTNKNEELISLPSDLNDIQERMNKIKQESLKNERLAKENEQRKNDLIVYLAHDIKTPLTSMIGYLSLLDEIKDMPKNKQEKYIKIALDKSYKLEELINELFDIARFSSEKIVLEKEFLNLNTMLEQIVDDFYPVLEELNKKIIIKKSDLIEIYGDSEKLARVFNNVIKNAINYSLDNSEITIDIIKDERFANVIISNKGKKISEDKLNRIFEKFYRVDSSRTTKTGGSGLGLAIAKEIVELHNGEISVTSDDKFTKFYIKLPINNE